MITRGLIALVLLVLLGYGALEARPLLLGPTLSVEGPTDYATVEGGVVVVSGTVSRASSFTLNGAPLLADQDGAFKAELAVARGTSILTLVATDRFGRSITKSRTVFVP